MSEFIKNLKVGDIVIVENRYSQSVRKVDRITPAGNIVVCGVIYNKNGLERCGDTWNKNFLSEATPESINKIHREATINKAYRLMRNITGITFEQAKKIIAILTQPKGTEQ